MFAYINIPDLPHIGFHTQGMCCLKALAFLGFILRDIQKYCAISQQRFFTSKSVLYCRNVEVLTDDETL